MATLIPKILIGPAVALTAVVSPYVSPAATNGVIRTIRAEAKVAATTITVSLGADAVGTRIIDSNPVPQNNGFLFNGWILTAQNSAHAIDVTSNATGTNCIGNVSGYEWG